MAEGKQISDAIVAFALAGQFPDDISALPPVSQTDLAPAIASLNESKAKLEVGMAVGAATRTDLAQGNIGLHVSA